MFQFLIGSSDISESLIVDVGYTIICQFDYIIIEKKDVGGL